ncbi:MAG: hypothetical protein M3296_01585 [Actinomycetota bacterium]|nr:hypothetical protein [Actinomycetota bacterium]
MSTTPHEDTQGAAQPQAERSNGPDEQRNDGPPFRFYDNRQKYLAFVNTCNEKQVVAREATNEVSALSPSPPALRIFDAGMGDASVLATVMSGAHRHFPTVPLLAVAKEISLEDVRLGLEKMPDRFFEHPHTVLVITNLTYRDAPALYPAEAASPKDVNWEVVRLEGQHAHQFGEQIENLDDLLAHGWQTKPSEKTGNPVYVRPSVLVVYREDHEFLLDSVIPRPGRHPGRFDFALASQPWRAATSATFKAEKVLAPLARALAPGGRLLVLQSYGQDPGLEVVQRLWPGENPFQVDRYELLRALEQALGPDAQDFLLNPPPDSKALLRFHMHTLPSEIGDRIGTSTLFAAWNAVIYVNQVEDERLDPVVKTGAYLQATREVLQKYDGLWFQDEKFVVSRRH